MDTLFGDYGGVIRFFSPSASIPCCCTAIYRPPAFRLVEIGIV